MYVAHIMLFLIFTAQIARTVRKFDNPMYEDEFNVHNFLEHPDVLIGQALTLRYKPVNLDVLPLYITLIAASPFILWCLLRRPNWTLLGSVILYVVARWFDWNLASYPPGTTWYFNPFAWQLMFVFAAWCGVGGVAKLQAIIQSRAALILAFAWIAFAFLIVMTWHIAFLDAMVPKWMIKAIYPIDKTDLDMLRFTHFLALALIVSRYFPRKSEILASKWLRPMILCGQHSLPIFCFGVFLSFGAHWILMQYAQGWRVWEQLVVSVGGILIMIGLAWLLDRAEKVPNLFVDAAEFEGRQAGAGTREGVIPGVPLQLVSFLAQRFGQAHAQIVGRLAAHILADLGALAARWLASLPEASVRPADDRTPLIRGARRREVVGIDGGDTVDHRGIIWRKRIDDHRHHRIVIAFDLGPVLVQRRLEAEQDGRQQRLVLIG